MLEDDQYRIIKAQLTYLDERKARAREETSRAIEKLMVLQSKIKTAEGSFEQSRSSLTNRSQSMQEMSSWRNGSILAYNESNNLSIIDQENQNFESLHQFGKGTFDGNAQSMISKDGHGHQVTMQDDYNIGGPMPPNDLSTIKDLKFQLKCLKEESEQKLEEAKATIGKLEDELRKFRDLRTNDEMENSDRLVSLEDELQQVKDLREREIQDANAQLSSLLMEKSVMEDTLVTVESENTSLGVELSCLQSKIRIMQQEKEIDMAKIDCFLKEKEATVAEIASINLLRDQLESAVSHHNDEINVLKAHLVEVQLECSDQKQTIENLQSQISQMSSKEETNVLKAQLVEVQLECSDQKQTIEN
eukprot:gene11187-23374_t